MKSSKKCDCNCNGLWCITIGRDDGEEPDRSPSINPLTWGRVKPRLEFRTISTVVSNTLSLWHEAEPSLSSKQAADCLKKLLEEEGEEKRKFTSFTKFKVTMEVVALIITISCLVASLTSSNYALRHKSHHGLRSWRWIVLVMESVCGLTVIRSITYVVIWIITKHRIIRLYNYVVFFAWGLKSNFDVTAWFGLVFFSWLFWFKPHIQALDWDASDTAKALRYTTMTLLCLALGSLFWLMKTILILTFEANLHYYGSFSRIRQTILDLHGIRIIEKIGDWCFLKSTKNNVWMVIEDMRDEEVVPVWIIKRLEKLYLRDIEDNPLDQEAAEDDRKLFKKAEGLLRQIINTADQPKRGYIIPEDLVKYRLTNDEMDHLIKLFGKKWADQNANSTHQTQAATENTSTGEHNGIHTFLNALGGGVQGHPPQMQAAKENQEENPQQNEPAIATLENVAAKYKGFRIDRKTFLSWAVPAYRNCWRLKQTLASSKAAIIKLDRLLSFIVLLIVSIIWLLVTNILSTNKLALLFSPFLASTFIFGNSCQELFHGLIFTFGMHPFNVGDRVSVENMKMRAMKINLLTTVFFKYDTREVVVYPNSRLAGISISNLDISPDQGDSLEFSINAETPLEDITDVQNRIKRYFYDEPEYSAHSQVVQKEFKMGKENELKMEVRFKYLVSYIDSETRAAHRSKIFSAIKEFVRSMNNRSGVTTQPDEILVFNIDPWTSLKKIKEVEAKIMRKLSKLEKFEKSKLLINENNGREMKMDFYLIDSSPCLEVLPEDEEIKRENMKLALDSERQEKDNENKEEHLHSDPSSSLDVQVKGKYVKREYLNSRKIENVRKEIKSMIKEDFPEACFFW